MVSKCSWVSFWSYAKAKVVSFFHSDETSLRRSVQQQTPDANIPLKSEDSIRKSPVEYWFHIQEEKTLEELGSSPIHRPEPEPILGRFEGKTWLQIQEEVIKESFWKEFTRNPPIKISAEPAVQGSVATKPNSSNLLSTKEISTLDAHQDQNTIFMFNKLKADFEALLTKIGLVSHRLVGYITIAISFGYNLISAISGPIGQIAIKDLLPTGQDAALVEDFIAAVVKGIGYLTQSQSILNAATPDAMLQLFLTDLKNDVPGLQKSKIFTLVVQIVGYLDGNSKIDSVYNFLVGKYFLKTKLDNGASANAIPAPVAKPA